MNPYQKPFRALKKTIFSLFILPGVLILCFFISPQRNEAASGGRIGGGDFRAPSIQRSNSYGGNSGGYGTYGGGYRGGGIGFPFLLPIFGFGGGGLFGFLILMAISGVIVNTIRSNNPSESITNRPTGSIQNSMGPVTIIQFQIGLLASAKAIQEDLRNLASFSDTSNVNGLKKVLEEITLALLRQPELWQFANIETGNVPFNSAESTFSRLSLTERSKLSAEIISNYSGQTKIALPKGQEAKEATPINEFIAVTILVASKSNPQIQQSNNHEGVGESLKTLGSISTDNLIALEVIWQPEGKGDSLSREELVISYPNLKYL